MLAYEEQSALDLVTAGPHVHYTLKRQEVVAQVLAQVLWDVVHRIVEDEVVIGIQYPLQPVDEFLPGLR